MIVHSVSDLPDLRSAKHIVLDTETSGLDPYKGDRICGISIGTEDDSNIWYVPVRHLSGNVDRDAVFSWLRDLGQDTSKTFLFHNAKFDLKMLRRDGVEINGRLRDTMVMAHILSGGEPSFSLDALSAKYCGIKSSECEKLEQYLTETQSVRKKKTEWGQSGYNYSLVPVEILGPYAVEDIYSTRSLWQAQMKRVMKDPYRAIDNHGMQSWGLIELIANEMKLIRVLFEMEDRGIKVDLERTVKLLEKARDEMESFRQRMWDLSGGIPFEPTQYMKMAEAYERAGGEVRFWTKPKYAKGKQKLKQFTTNRDFSTLRPNWNSAAVYKYLEGHLHDGNNRAFEFLMAYNGYMSRAKICSTYLEAFCAFADGNSRVHGQFSQIGTITGRLASQAPNLQNCAKVSGTADQKALEKLVGKKDEDALNRQVRSLFVAEPGKVLVSIDWSQVEYRCAAVLARDMKMIKAWQADPKLDYHAATVELMEGKIDRDGAKTCNFLKLYAGGPSALADVLTASGNKTTVDQAKVIFAELDRARPAMPALLNRLSEEAKQKGYVQNCFGRRVDVPKEQAYKALNYRDQGETGDAMRLALVRLHERIQSEKLPVEMLLTVHDEVVFTMQEKDVREIAPKLAATMCWSKFWDVPLIADVECGKDWGSLEALK